MTRRGCTLSITPSITPLAQGAQFVLLGSATDKRINDWFWHEKLHLNSNPDVHLELSFNEELAHLIYAGADMMVVPSNFEPCGLTQMIAMKYGTVPIVRGVGGLVNTVFDWDYDQNHTVDERNGFVFFQTDHSALESAMNRAFNIWNQVPLTHSKKLPSRECSMTIPGTTRQKPM